MRAADFLKSRGAYFPKPNEKGEIYLEDYQKAGIAMVVSCCGCETTMVFRPDTLCDDNGAIYCNDCY